MNKVAAYLNEHLAGEVLVNEMLLAETGHDHSILAQHPELVARVADTSDIRKILRFCSQLASKGHILPVVARGYGTDTTGGASGRGIIIDLAAHMYHIVGIDPKQQLIHLQAGLSHRAAQATLSTHKSLALPEVSMVGEDGTIGGALGVDALGSLNAHRGRLGNTIQQMEVVLSNGETLQTGRLSKRELNHKKGLTTFEGKIYRELDNLISDYQELIDQLGATAPETAGLAQIAKVRQADGSFNLAPLFIGSQGSLGIISEVIVKAGFVSPETTVVAAAFKSMEAAQMAIDAAVEARASSVELYDGRLVAAARSYGKKLDWMPKECAHGGVVLAVFDAFSNRNRAKSAKKLLKKIHPDTLCIKELSIDTTALSTLRSTLIFAQYPAEEQVVSPASFSGIWLPNVQLDGFIRSLRKLEKQYEIILPFFVEALSGAVTVYPLFACKKVSDRQKIIKLTADMVRLTTDHDGSFAGFGGEGRFKAAFIQPILSVAERELYAKIKHIFDPYNILNPGIKTSVPLKEIAEEFNAWCRLH